MKLIKSLLAGSALALCLILITPEPANARVGVYVGYGSVYISIGPRYFRNRYYYVPRYRIRRYYFRNRYYRRYRVRSYRNYRRFRINRGYRYYRRRW